MKTKKPMVPSNRSIVAKARKVLAFAEEFAATAKYHSELFNAIFAPGGKAAEFFTTQEERRAHTKTAEYKKLFKLIAALPQGPLLERSTRSTSPTSA